MFPCWLSIWPHSHNIFSCFSEMVSCCCGTDSDRNLQQYKGCREEQKTIFYCRPNVWREFTEEDERLEKQMLVLLLFVSRCCTHLAKCEHQALLQIQSVGNTPSGSKVIAVAAVLFHTSHSSICFFTVQRRFVVCVHTITPEMKNYNPGCNFRCKLIQFQLSKPHKASFYLNSRACYGC